MSGPDQCRALISRQIGREQVKMRRFHKGAAIVAGSLLVIIFVAFVLLKFFLLPHPCDRLDTVLARNSDGATVVDVFRACTVVGTSVVERVDLVTASGHRVQLLTFVPWDGEVPPGVRVNAPFRPSATWLTAHDLSISIGTVDRVLQERVEAAGTHVRYNIRTVLSERQ